MKTTKIIAAAAATTFAAAAFAGPVNVDYTGTGAGSNVKITNGSSTYNVFAGQLKHTLSGAPALTRCGTEPSARTAPIFRKLLSVVWIPSVLSNSRPCPTLHRWELPRPTPSRTCLRTPATR